MPRQSTTCIVFMGLGLSDSNQETHTLPNLQRMAHWYSLITFHAEHFLVTKLTRMTNILEDPHVHDTSEDKPLVILTKGGMGNFRRRCCQSTSRSGRQSLMQASCEVPEPFRGNTVVEQTPCWLCMQAKAAESR